jgi:hypothetical protein
MPLTQQPLSRAVGDWPRGPLDEWADTSSGPGSSARSALCTSPGARRTSPSPGSPGAPPHPGGPPHLADWVMVEAYWHEVSNCGFWPGGSAEGSFYSYAYPEPEGYARHRVGPSEAAYSKDLGGFVLPYEAVRTAPAPDRPLLEFLRAVTRPPPSSRLGPRHPGGHPRAARLPAAASP